jgi:hypothetical protein
VLLVTGKAAWLWYVDLRERRYSMNTLNKPVDSDAGTPEQVLSVADPKRRKLTTAGLAGAGVLMSLSSRSALGAGFGQCGSESVSAAMSRHGEVSYCGCSPGFWWRSPHGIIKWSDQDIIPAIYGPNQTFNSVFGVALFKSTSNRTLVNLGPGANKVADSEIRMDSLKGCSHLTSSLFHAIAGLLNASFYGERYPAQGYQTPAAVIAAVQAALMSLNPCSALGILKGKLDIYDQYGDLWCFNGVTNGSTDWIQKY